MKQHSQPQSVVNQSQPNESDEGSLNLGQFVGALRRKVLLIGGVTALVTFLALLKALNNTPTYSAKFEILTQPLTAENQITASIPDTLANKETGIVDDNMLKVLTSPSVMTPIVDQLKGKYPDLTRASLSQNLSVGSALKSNSKILVVTYHDEDPTRVKVVLETVAEAFLAYSLRSRQADVRQGIDFVKQQLPEQQQRVENVQQELQQLRERYKLVDPDSRGNQLVQQVATFSQQQLDTEVTLKQLQAVEAELETQLATQPTESVGASALNNAPRYQAILSELLKVDNQIAQTSILFQETSPDMQYLREQRQKLLSLLTQEGRRVQSQVKDQIQELEARDRALSETLVSLNGEITELSGISRKYVEIQRELQIATQNLNQFLTKEAALEIDSAQRKVPWELLTPPTYPQVTAESVQRNLIEGMILGLLIGTGIALASDKLSNVLYSSREIKQLTNLPLLGVIPFNVELSKSGAKDISLFLQKVKDTDKSSQNGSPRVYRPVPFVEAFRFLYTNIHRFNPEMPVRSLVVSSPMLEDGKSTIALCLAQTVANTGQRVLIVDADLRRPQLHRYLGLSNRRGLTDVIAGDETPGNVIQQSAIDPNLFVLTTGLIPPDPIKFFSSQKMRSLMEKSPQMFDLVIYDTPPLLGFVDASLMTPYTDGMLLVVGLGQLKSSLLEQALEQLKVSGTSVLGIVANGSRDLSLNMQNIYQQEDEPEEGEPHLIKENPETSRDESAPVPSSLKNWDLN